MKKDKEDSILKTVKPKRKYTKTKTPKTKTPKISNKKLEIQFPSHNFPGQIRTYVIWDSPTNPLELKIGDEVITACGYNGKIVSFGENINVGKYATILDLNLTGYHTVMLQAIIKL